MDFSHWPWTRVAVLALGVVAVGAAFLIPGAQAALLPVGSLLVGTAIQTPGFTPARKTPPAP